MKQLTQLTLTLFAFLVCTASAYACSCADPSPQEKFRAAKFIFIGRIIEVKPNLETKGDSQYFPDVVTFGVEKQWKGARRQEIIVLASSDWVGMCNDLKLTVGEKYLIYAQRQKGRLVIHRDCGPNLLLRFAAKDIKLLNKL